MQFLHNLLYSKRPENSTLLDIALVLSILPHLFISKFFILIYLFIAFVFILKKQKYFITPYIFMVVGIVLIAINFFDDYNFSNLSKMSFFISLISTLLIYVVTLQKLTGVVNIYLKISPILLMLLSFFFFDSITMLFYSIFVFFIFTLMYIWSRMDAIFIDVLKKTSQLFLLSIPSVIIMFLAFPRISFDTAEFGFRGETYTTSGYDGVMDVSSKEIRLSDKIIMEVSFEDENISDSSLYFRGSSLSWYHNNKWSKSPTFSAQDTLKESNDFISYNISLYPHSDHWLYALDLPLATPSKTKRNGDYTLSTKKKVYEKKRYQLESALSYKLTTNELDHYLDINTTQHQQTYLYLREFISSSMTNQEKTDKLIQFFQDQNLSYSLKPIHIEKENFTDTFLFEGKNGYCVHFASAFATSARLIGIPSRVITGFKPSKENMMNNYLLVKARDAHAWVELYSQDKGWVRYDPTSYASQTLNAQTTLNQVQEEKTFFDSLNLYYMYVKYSIEEWVLNYNHFKQLDILDKLLNDVIYLLQFLLGLFGSFLLLFIFYLNIRKSKSKDKVVLEMQKLLKFLEKRNITKKDYETMEEYLMLAQQKLGMSLKTINYNYHLLKYSKSKDDLIFKNLQNEIQKLIKKISKTT